MPYNPHAHKKVETKRPEKEGWGFFTTVFFIYIPIFLTFLIIRAVMLYNGIIIFHFAFVDEYLQEFIRELQNYLATL